MGFHRLAIVATMLGIAFAHSWIEQLSNIAPNSSYFGEHGYPRSFVDKGMLGFDQNANLWLIPPLEQQPPFIRSTDLLCHPSQRTNRSSSTFPRLKTTPGSIFAMRYADNGHATIPGGGKGLPGKPDQGGTVFVFGTSQPRGDETLSNVLKWTPNGLGGDRRGIRLAAQNFDDGRCYQLGNGAELANLRREKFPNPIAGQLGTEHEILCETDVRLPDSVEVDQPYTLYWVWQWATAPEKDPNFPNGRDEYYVSCVDIDIVREVFPVQASHFLLQQDPIPTALSNFRSRTALTTDPLALYSNSRFGIPCATECATTAPVSATEPAKRDSQLSYT
jgi:hypothetical protein